ncbi:MAG: hypothetical protein PHR81_10935 [Bacteroidales bacterium]|nr:hypothetical protein [Bacteroidales bacterium]
MDTTTMKISLSFDTMSRFMSKYTFSNPTGSFSFDTMTRFMSK